MPSHNRFLTTHVGSLPRQEELMQIMFAREDGIPLDQAALERKITEAVEDVVARQLKAGVDIINDGEMSKPSYATYIKDRLNGFGGTGNSFLFQDIEDYPEHEGARVCRPGPQASQDAGVQRPDQRARHGSAEARCRSA